GHEGDADEDAEHHGYGSQDEEPQAAGGRADPRQLGHQPVAARPGAVPRAGPGTRVRATIASRASAVERPESRASVLGSNRWARTGRASSAMSSGRTWSRPAIAAWALAARSSWMEARGEAPRRSSASDRVAVTSSSRYCLIAGAT